MSSHPDAECDQLQWCRENIHQPGVLARFAGILVARAERTATRVVKYAERIDTDEPDGILERWCGRR